MANKVSIRFYKDSKVRAVWDEEQNKWFFSIVDIVAAITESPRPRVYWGTVKNRQKAQYGELYSKCIQLKLLSADGKRYATDCFAQEDIIEVVKTLPAKNTTAFLDWFTYSDATQRGYGEWKDWWEFPGGKIEAGETPQQALKREIREELDAEIEVGALLRKIDYDYPAFHLTMHCFKCSLDSAVTLLEHEAAKWLKPEELNSVRWLPADEEIISHRNGLRHSDNYLDWLI